MIAGNTIILWSGNLCLHTWMEWETQIGDLISVGKEVLIISLPLNDGHISSCHLPGLKTKKANKERCYNSLSHLRSMLNLDSVKHVHETCTLPWVVTCRREPQCLPLVLLSLFAQWPLPLINPLRRGGVINQYHVVVSFNKDQNTECWDKTCRFNCRD